MSVQRIQTVAPFGIESPEMLALNAVCEAAALPFLAPTVAVSGVTTFSPGTFVHVPLVGSVAFVLYAKLS